MFETRPTYLCPEEEPKGNFENRGKQAPSERYHNVNRSQETPQKGRKMQGGKVKEGKKGRDVTLSMIGSTKKKMRGDPRKERELGLRRGLSAGNVLQRTRIKKIFTGKKKGDKKTHQEV